MRSKGNFLLILAILVVLTVGFGLWYALSQNEGIKAPSKVTAQTDCEAAEFPFACYLDKAMQSRDPSKCADAGLEKRVACLRSYAEIMDTKIDCGVIKDGQFATECAMVLRDNQPAPKQTTSTTLPPGLRVDRP